MATPQEGYPPQGYPAADQYGQQSPGFEAAGSPPPPGGAPQPDKKKKRGYAQQAYDFGGNSALSQPPGPQQFQPVGGQGAAYGGYPPGDAQPSYNAGGYGAQVGAAPIGAPAQEYGTQFGGGVGGYQPPVAGYPGPGAPVGGVDGITSGMGQMGMGGAQAPAQQPQQPGGRGAMVLNTLYPTDLLNQPFNVAELELPPPPIILPANVSYQDYFFWPSTNKSNSLALRHLPIPTVLQNTFAQLLMLCQLLIPFSKSRSFLLLLSFSHTLLFMILTTRSQLYKTK